ncbi:LysM peptidoglycan-binding domain-containing protein [Caldanaerobacter sp.]|uniref:LysM peptidoglycan-binding domain-containing protein n=1 Tax=Caldanaerobacter sp. TaxID=2930036 RepID=UPI003C788978
MITIEIPYVVQPGDTIFSIARKFNTSVEAIITRNGITNPSLIYPGQRLIIPVKGDYYTVQPGDTVYLIAQRFNVPYETIIYVNNLNYPYNIYPGQKLFIPGITASYPPSPVPPVPSSGPCPKYYTVQPGDTLWSIAQKFGISIDDLIRSNYLLNPSMIYPGQTLIIPCPSTPPLEYPTLKLGDRGPFVVNLQARLKSLGFDPGPIDGIFGPRTEAAVKAYQQSRGLPSTGIVDEMTWNALLFATPPASSPAAGKVYIVKPGDSLWTIAQKFNTSVDAILKANPEIKDPNLIYPGQRIIIPGTSEKTIGPQEIPAEESQEGEEK